MIADAILTLVEQIYSTCCAAIYRDGRKASLSHHASLPCMQATRMKSSNNNADLSTSRRVFVCALSYSVAARDDFFSSSGAWGDHHIFSVAVFLYYELFLLPDGDLHRVTHQPRPGTANLRGPWRCTKRALAGELLADIRRRPSNKDVVDPVIIHPIIVPRERVAPLSPTGATAVIHRGFDLLRCPNPDDVFAFGFVRRPSRRIALSRRVEKTRSLPSRDRHSTSRQAAFRMRIPSRIDSLPACTLDSPSDASRILAFRRD